MKWTWDYVAGLFDGEGHVHLDLWNREAKLRIVFSTSNNEVAKQLTAFMGRRGIQFQEYRRTTNHFGESGALRFERWEACRRIAEKLIPRTMEKRPQLELALEAVHLHDRCVAEGWGAVSRRAREFDDIRHRLHDHTRKGPRVLLEYNFG